MKFPEVDKEHFPQDKNETEVLGERTQVEALHAEIEALKADLASKEAAIQSWEAKATEYANEINNLREQLMANTVPASGDSSRVAMICHEANRALCRAFGDDSQPTWDDAPEWQRESAVKGVELHRADQSLGPDASHNAWMQHKASEGWVYGETKDAVAKTHPCMVPYDQLPQAQQAKDYVFQAIVHAMGRL